MEGGQRLMILLAAKFFLNACSDYLKLLDKHRRSQIPTALRLRCPASVALNGDFLPPVV
jgi:hypothetical protein